MDRIKYLVNKGKSQGYIEFRDLREALPYEDIDEEEMKDILQILKDMGIDVKMNKAEIVELSSLRDKGDDN